MAEHSGYESDICDVNQSFHVPNSGAELDSFVLDLTFHADLYQRLLCCTVEEGVEDLISISDRWPLGWCPCGAHALGADLAPAALSALLDDLYRQRGASGGRRGDGLAPKTILEVHMIICAASPSPYADNSSSTTSTSSIGWSWLIPPHPVCQPGPRGHRAGHTRWRVAITIIDDRAFNRVGSARVIYLVLPDPAASAAT